MSEFDQLLSQINSGQMPSQRLKELQVMANDQLLRYEQGLTAITKNGDSFTFEDYKEALQLASGGNQGSISRSEWDQVSLFPEKRLKLRDQLIDTIKQGQQQFVTIKTAIDAKLSPKESGFSIMSWFNTIFGKATKKAPEQDAQIGKETEIPPIEKKIESGDILELKALEKAIVNSDIPIDREPYNALLQRIADSKNNDAIPILQNISKAAEDYLVLFKKAELHKKPGMWMISTNVEGIISRTREAIGKINSEA